MAPSMQGGAVIYLDRLQAGLVALVAGVAPGATALWAHSEYPRGLAADAVVTVNRAGGGWAATEDHSPQRRYLPTQALLTVGGDSANARACTIYATGARWRVEVPAMTSDADYRDAIQTALTEVGHDLRATFTPIGSTQLQLDGDFLGALGEILVRGAATVVHTARQLSELTAGVEQSRIEVQAYSTTRYPNGGAHDLIAQLRQSIYRPQYVSLLDRYGLTILNAQPTVDLTSRSGPDWQSRAAMDLIVTQRSDVADAVDPVAEAAATITEPVLNEQIEVSSEP